MEACDPILRDFLPKIGSGVAGQVTASIALYRGESRGAAAYPRRVCGSARAFAR